MDTSEHLRVAQEAIGFPFSMEACIAALESAGLLCTRAERNVLEAATATSAILGGGGAGTWDPFVATLRALHAERASAHATAAKERAKPKEGARRTELERKVLDTSLAMAASKCFSPEHRKAGVAHVWASAELLVHENAREHAAKLTAEQGGSQ